MILNFNRTTLRRVAAVAEAGPSYLQAEEAIEEAGGEIYPQPGSLQ